MAMPAVEKASLQFQWSQWPEMVVDVGKKTGLAVHLVTVCRLYAGSFAATCQHRIG